MSADALVAVGFIVAGRSPRRFTGQACSCLASGTNREEPYFCFEPFMDVFCTKLLLRLWAFLRDVLPKESDVSRATLGGLISFIPFSS